MNVLITDLANKHKVSLQITDKLIKEL